MNYSVAIRTLGKGGHKYQILLDSLQRQTIKPYGIYVYIAEGYPLPQETIGVEQYIYVKKGMVTQRALEYKEIDSDYILFLDDDVYLPHDGVEKLFKTLLENGAQVVSPDVFPNSERTVGGKFLMAISGRMYPRRDDKKWAYKIMRNSGYSYNRLPSQDVYLSETNAGPCFLCSKKDFLKIRFEEERWLEKCSYALGDDQAMFYKMFCLGYKQLTLFNSGIIHLDAGSTLQSENKEKKLIFADFRFKTIFWHRFIYLPEKRTFYRLISLFSILYTVAFSMMVSFSKGQFNILKLKCEAIRDGIAFLRSDEYHKIPKIIKL